MQSNYLNDPEDLEDDEEYYDDEGIEIHTDTYDKDFDDINFDGDNADDRDIDAAEEFDY